MDRFQKNRDVVEKYLREIRGICLENSIELYIVLMPTKEEVYCDYIASKLGIGNADKTRVLNYYSSAREICRDNDIRFIDLLPELKKSANLGRKLYFTHDGHWNKKGNSLVASIIYDVLKDKD